ncbi:MAG: hypothetical protein A2600_09000 [Candidatus Lambdaproteobacteria bacterium RIFOXYD1_FULL_56_27]|uniref:Uncharacterized protein n=1 Tax=Candidatus Lambdaproteobacteria bacterium RIFOXYD2_FULL_56_26 TaxID=1817773 RepID=A0A1F6GYU9_9PROT|nr:MAG: hypothetical protein A2426_10420 [Candidatus Lambdaproteobacteria bacterium RIFOXYC1_FULL_56_13]OGH03328.1 MAG: hypothetical protein A2557_02265 [Candidatus Lambdaproteobacteria bacterium RIFOXYD2_FULL_56_26]OGH06667.1 MAG: hypothetical protein A2600_09000 [Candidatus Lambdaproteobacteria bacterium RIFOXYD1_FULL_56_27]
MNRQKGEVPHDRLLLSKAVAEKLYLKISFPDGEYLIDQLRWHTVEHLGLQTGKVVNQRAIKYWEILPEYRP